MKGSTGTSLRYTKLVSNHPAAIKRRQTVLKSQFNAIPTAKLDAITARGGMSLSQAKQYVRVAQKKEQAINDLSRNEMEFEVAFTLVKGTKAIRVAYMTREKARLWNDSNTKLGTGLYWVMGKQKIQ